MRALARPRARQDRAHLGEFFTCGTREAIGDSADAVREYTTDIDLRWLDGPFASLSDGPRSCPPIATS